MTEARLVNTIICQYLFLRIAISITMVLFFSIACGTVMVYILAIQLQYSNTKQLQYIFSGKIFYVITHFDMT